MKWADIWHRIGFISFILGTCFIFGSFLLNIKIEKGYNTEMSENLNKEKIQGGDLSETFDDDSSVIKLDNREPLQEKAFDPSQIFSEESEDSEATTLNIPSDVRK